MQQIQTTNGQPTFEVLTGGAYSQALKNKLVEETNEVLAAKDNNDLMDELGDVIEVVNALAKCCGLSMEQISQRAARKKEERGGFEGGYKLLTIQLDEKDALHKKWIAYYTSQPCKHLFTIT